MTRKEKPLYADELEVTYRKALFADKRRLAKLEKGSPERSEAIATAKRTLTLAFFWREMADILAFME